MLEKAGKLRDEGGVAVINKLMNELPELLNRNKQILDVVKALLSEIRKYSPDGHSRQICAESPFV